MIPTLLNPKYVAEVELHLAVQAERESQRNWEWEHGGKQRAESHIGRAVQFLSSSPQDGCYGRVVSVSRDEGRGACDLSYMVRLSPSGWRFGANNTDAGIQVKASLNDLKFID